MSEDLGDLCERAKAGDAAAASNLVAAHYERIFGYFRRLGANDEDAADLTQKTFFKVWVSLHSYAGQSSFSSWIHGIAHHVFVDWIRSRRPVDHPAADWWEACPDDGPSPYEDTAEKDSARRLFALVERLDEEGRQVIHLHYYQGLSLAETAQVLDRAVSTIKYRLRAALDFLKAQAAEPRFRPVSATLNRKGAPL